MTPLLLALGCGLGTHPDAYTGTIEVTEIEVAAAVPGRLTAVFPEEGDLVAAGDPVFTLDSALFEAERDLRRSGVAQAEAGAEAAKAQLRAAQAQVAFARRELERVQGLERAGVGTAQQISTLTGQLDVARAQASAARKQIDRAAAAGDQASAGLRAADKQLAEAAVPAVVGGVVLSRNREPGEVVAPGMSVVTLGDLSHPRLRIYAPLLQVEALALGDTVDVRLDARPDETVPGRVARISPRAEFTPRDILTPEERVKRVFAVDIALEPGPGIHPGLPAEAYLEE